MKENEFDLSKITIEGILLKLKDEKFSGVIYLEDNKEKGEIHLKDGHIVHSSLGSIEGEMALLSFVAWPEGKASFIPYDETLPGESITYETDFLIENCIKERSTINSMMNVVPNLDIIFEVVDSGTPKYIKTAELTVLPWIDGRNTVREIAQEMVRDYPGVIKSIYKLFNKNIICKR